MDNNLYSVKVMSTRSEYSGFRFDLSPRENEIDNDNYGTTFKIVVTDKQKEVAILSGKIFDENKVYASAQDILNVADPLRGHERDLAECMNGCKEMVVRAADRRDRNGYSGYITFCCVHEDYRKRGIASYLLNNLHLLLKHTLNVELRCIAADPTPFDPSTYTYCENDEGRKIGVRLLTACGYHEIADEVDVSEMFSYESEIKLVGTGFYVKVYDVAEE